jgi:hypothetical protein
MKYIGQFFDCNTTELQSWRPPLRTPTSSHMNSCCFVASFPVSEKREIKTHIYRERNRGKMSGV